MSNWSPYTLTSIHAINYMVYGSIAFVGILLATMAIIALINIIKRK